MGGRGGGGGMIKMYIIYPWKNIHPFIFVWSRFHEGEGGCRPLAQGQVDQGSRHNIIIKILYLKRDTRRVFILQQHQHTVEFNGGNFKTNELN